jgi:diguanylate cyclase (GGDEF)-like protein
MQHRKPRVLILDDDPSITDLLSEILKEEGYEVMASNSPKDVLFLAHQFLPDILLLDIMMPELDGYDVCVFFRRDAQLKFTRIIVLTARDDRESRVRSYKAGADLVLSKPFEVEELRQVVSNYAESKLAREQTLEDLQSFTLVDPITNAHNRHYMEKRISEELKRLQRFKRPLAVILVHLDNLKSINVHYGYSLGNTVLKDVAEALRQELREFDLIARFNEDSFLILLPETGEKGAKSAASRMREIITSLVFMKRRKLTLQPAVYTACFQKDARPEDVLEELDQRINELHDHHSSTQN